MLTRKEYDDLLTDLADSDFIDSLSLTESEELDLVIQKYVKSGDKNENLR